MGLLIGYVALKVLLVFFFSPKQSQFLFQEGVKVLKSLVDVFFSPSKSTLVSRKGVTVP